MKILKLMDAVYCVRPLTSELNPKAVIMMSGFEASKVLGHSSQGLTSEVRAKSYIRSTVKKNLQGSRPQPGCHYTKLSLGGNNDGITELFLG